MGNTEVLLIRVVVVTIDSSDFTNAHHRVPHQREHHMGSGRVREFLEMIQNLLGSLWFQHLFSNVVAITQRWREHLGVEIRFDAVNRLKPSDEHAKRIHLRLFSRRREVTFLTSVESKFV